MVKSGHVLGFLLCEGVINSLDGGAEMGGRNKSKIFQVIHEHRIQQGASESRRYCMDGYYGDKLY